MSTFAWGDVDVCLAGVNLRVGDVTFRLDGVTVRSGDIHVRISDAPASALEPRCRNAAAARKAGDGWRGCVRSASRSARSTPALADQSSLGTFVVSGDDVHRRPIRASRELHHVSGGWRARRASLPKRTSASPASPSARSSRPSCSSGKRGAGSMSLPGSRPSPTGSAVRRRPYCFHPPPSPADAPPGALLLFLRSARSDHPQRDGSIVPANNHVESAQGLRLWREQIPHFVIPPSADPNKRLVNAASVPAAFIELTNVTVTYQ